MDIITTKLINSKQLKSNCYNREISYKYSEIMLTILGLISALKTAGINLCFLRRSILSTTICADNDIWLLLVFGAAYSHMMSFSLKFCYYREHDYLDNSINSWK